MAGVYIYTPPCVLTIGRASRKNAGIQSHRQTTALAELLLITGIGHYMMAGAMGMPDLPGKGPLATGIRTMVMLRLPVQGRRSSMPRGRHHREDARLDGLGQVRPSVYESPKVVRSR